jgi:HptB-dependent secretion and biofilm anti anti-sigma factor
LWGNAVEVPEDSLVKRFALDGEYDLSRRAEVAELFESVDGQPSVVIDLSNVTYIDSTILGALAVLRQRDPGRSIRLAGANEQVRRVLKVVGYHQIFDVTD